MRKLTYLLLVFLTLSFLFGCQHINESRQNSSKLETPSAITSKQQETSNQQSSQISSVDMNEKIDAFYKKWKQEQLKLDNGNFVNYYALERENSRTLLIYLDGSGYQSVMGVKDGGSWVYPGNPYSLANAFSDYDFLAVDKVNALMGQDCSNDSAVIENYTFENMVNGCAAAIDRYLGDKNYSEVIIMGLSEGGNILPRVYSLLKQKSKVTKLIVDGAGGLSQYEEFKVLGKTNLPMEPGYKEAYTQVEEVYKDVLDNPNSVEKQYFGYTYKRWNGFFKYKPIEDYKNIDIPILLLHGALDANSPVESARAVYDEFKKSGKSNLKYIEYADMGHNAETKEQNNRWFRDINSWLKNK